MENKNVGYLVLGMSVIIIVIVLLFNSALREIINSSCTMAGHTGCTMYDTLSKQTYLALSIVGVLVLVSFFLIFSKPNEKILIRKVREKKQPVDIGNLSLKAEEKQIFKMVLENKAIFQADLIEKTGFGKAKVTRILDRLEGHQLIERKRRGMTNVVILKEN